MTIPYRVHDSVHTIYKFPAPIARTFHYRLDIQKMKAKRVRSLETIKINKKKDNSSVINTINKCNAE
jgi:hypothetical protein